jgi:hypothetical protein
MLHVALNAAIGSHSFSKFAVEPFTRRCFLALTRKINSKLVGSVWLPNEPMFSAIQMRRKVSKVSGTSVMAESKRSLDYARSCRRVRIFDF